MRESTKREVVMKMGRGINLYSTLLTVTNVKVEKCQEVVASM